MTSRSRDSRFAFDAFLAHSFALSPLCFFELYPVASSRKVVHLLRSSIADFIASGFSKSGATLVTSTISAFPSNLPEIDVIIPCEPVNELSPVDCTSSKYLLANADSSPFFYNLLNHSASYIESLHVTRLTGAFFNSAIMSR